MKSSNIINVIYKLSHNNETNCSTTKTVNRIKSKQTGQVIKQAIYEM